MKKGGRLIRWLGVLSLLGGIIAVPLIMAFNQIGWGTPGTTVYQTYELLNRLMTVSLLLMTAGWLGVWLSWPRGYGRWASIVALIGSIMMVIGIGAEFWLYSDLSYAVSNMRQIAFSTFSIGSLLMDIGATVVGVAVWRSRLWPRWSAIILMLALPIDFAAFFWLESLFLAATILALVVGYNLIKAEKPPEEAGFGNDVSVRQ